MDDGLAVAQDYTDASADRGLTTEDVAEVALEEAGIGHTPRPRIGDSRPAPKPQIGDSRPASPGNGAGGNGAAATDAATGEPVAPKRRRRRGGRGRGRGGAGGNGGTTPASTAPGGGGGGRSRAPQPRRDDVVRADLGVGETPLAALDDDVLERRRGRTRKGRPAGRYLMCVHVLEGGHTHIAVLEGRSLVEHSLATPTGNESIDGNIYLGRVQNVLPGMEAAFVDIGTPKNGVLYRGDVAFDKSDVEGGNKPKIERMLKNGQMITVPGDQEPDRAQGRPSHPGGQPGRAVPGDGARRARHLRHLEAPPRRRAQAPAQGARRHPTVRRRADRAHRGRGRDPGRARARRRAGCGTSGSRSPSWPARPSRPSSCTRSPTSCSG